MPNNPESEDLEIVISYPSYSDIEFGSSVLKATSIDYEGVLAPLAGEIWDISIWYQLLRRRVAF